MGKAFTRGVGVWINGTFRMYVSTLVRTMSWKVALALVLMLSINVTQGAQLLLLVPLMDVVGLDVHQGSIGWLAGFVSSAFAAVGVQPSLVTVLIAFVLFTIVVALLTRWQTVFNFKLEQDFVATLRQRLYRAIANADWLTFSRKRSTDFTHALTTELDRVGSATALLLQLITDIILLSVYVLFALRLSATMTALMFVSGVALIMVLRRKAEAARWTGADLSLATSGLYSAAIEHMSGMKTTKSYGVEDRNADLFSKLADRVAQMQLNGTRNYAETAFWFTVGSAVILSIMLYVSFEILSLPAAGLLLLLFLFNRTIPLFKRVQQGYQQYLNALPAFVGVMELQARCEAAAEPRSDQPSRKVEMRDSIRFEGVSFAYPGKAAAPAIRDLNLDIPVGKTTALVGLSGAGKSTVADLLMGLIVPSSGRVVVDRVPLEAERLRPWRNQIGYVSQDTFLFNDTIRANLLWACPEASDDEIVRALRMAAADEFVCALPDGLETMLGDRGVRLSGGERQRLALARALVHQPALLILDEATSALDSENEKRIRSAIEGLHGQVTILLITHRLSTVRSADAIHVLEQGSLVESGGWTTLNVRTDGRFKALARAQDISIGIESGSLTNQYKLRHEALKDTKPA